MADAMTLCEQCDVPIPAGESAHFVHDDDCTRFLEGFCRCEGGWVCRACCPDEACSPLQTALALAREDTLARAQVWEDEHAGEDVA